MTQRGLTLCSGTGRTPQLLLWNLPLLEQKSSSRWHQQDGKTGFKLLKCLKIPQIFHKAQTAQKKNQSTSSWWRWLTRRGSGWPSQGWGHAQDSRTQIKHTQFKFPCMLEQFLRQTEETAGNSQQIGHWRIPGAALGGSLVLPFLDNASKAEFLPQILTRTHFSHFTPMAIGNI